MKRYEVSSRDAVDRSSDKTTLEKYLLDTLGLGPRARLKEAFLAGKILRNGKRARRTDLVEPGDTVEIDSEEIFSSEEVKLSSSPFPPLPILTETKDLLLIDKPAGIHTHPQAPSERDTALQRILGIRPEVGQAVHPGRPLEGTLLHRLDQGTSGVLAFARSASAYKTLRTDWRDKTKLWKVYLAWVQGRMEQPMELHTKMAHDPKNRARMAVFPSEQTDLPGRAWDAVTTILPLTAVSAAETLCTPVLIRLHTGITHQIRANLEALGHPILGDPVYTKGASSMAERLIPRGIGRDEAKGLRDLADRFLSVRASPIFANLPRDGFFLHALALMFTDFSSVGALEAISPPPSYFGIR